MPTSSSSPTIGAWLRMQRQLQLTAFDLDPSSLGPESRAEFVRWNALALEDELHEMLQEVGWKPWASSRHLNRDAYLNEVVDLMHFLGNLILVACLRDGTVTDEYMDVEGLARELWSKYEAKHHENLRRQREGYEGVKEKCPICRRELWNMPPLGTRYDELEHCIPGYCIDAGPYTPGEAQVGKGEG